MEAGPIAGYRDAAARAGRGLKLGEDLMIGLVTHLADTRERATREIVPLYDAKSCRSMKSMRRCLRR